MLLAVVEDLVETAEMAEIEWVDVEVAAVMAKLQREDRVLAEEADIMVEEVME